MSDGVVPHGPMLHTEAKQGPMSLAEAQAYVARHGTIVRMRDPIPRARFFECMDDRQSRAEGNADSAKYPDGGLGIAATTLATLHQLGASEAVTFGPVMNFLEHKLGGMSFHSDHHNAHDPFPAAGCGHVNGVLNNDAYRLGTYRESLKKYADRLTTREDRHERGIIGYSYSGDHAARAVILIDDRTRDSYLSVPGRDVGGQAFIINDTLNQRVLGTLAIQLYRTFGPEFKVLGISVQALVTTMIATYQHQLTVSLHALGKGLPVYHAVADKSRVWVDDAGAKIP